uniref:Uncharacterized protein n=1 Tax=Cannabis sativa TaxID=3483 RepID=A0A803PKW4_CANSA
MGSLSCMGPTWTERATHIQIGFRSNYYYDIFMITGAREFSNYNSSSSSSSDDYDKDLDFENMFNSPC